MSTATSTPFSAALTAPHRTVLLCRLPPVPPLRADGLRASLIPSAAPLGFPPAALRQSQQSSPRSRGISLQSRKLSPGIRPGKLFPSPQFSQKVLRLGDRRILGAISHQTVTRHRHVAVRATSQGSDNSASSESDSSGSSGSSGAPQVPGKSPGSPNVVPRSRPSYLDIPFDPAVDATMGAEMAGRKSNEPPPPGEEGRKATQLGTLWKQFVRVAAPYWSSEDKGQARLRLAAVFVFALGCTGVSVLFNFLYRDFYNAIASKDEEAFLRQLLWFLGATVGGVPVFVFRDYLRDTLSLRWRAWMTTDLLSKYFQHRTFYNIQSQSLIDNPDQRINEDVNQFTTTSLAFSLALVNAVVDLVSFSGILYSIYPPLFGVLLAYSLGGTAISVYLGRELVGLNFLQEKKEADFRYGLVRARENAESIAFYGGERSETRLLLQRFRQSFSNYARLLVVGRNLDFFTSNYRYLIQLLPAAVVAPLFFRGEIEFGVINQSFSAFNHVLGDFSIIVFQFQALSEFSAIVERLGEFQEVLDEQSKPAALPAAATAAGVAGAATGGRQDKNAEERELDASAGQPTAAEHLASLFNSYITIENVILPAWSPSAPAVLPPGSSSRPPSPPSLSTSSSSSSSFPSAFESTQKPSLSTSSSSSSSSSFPSAPASPRVLLELDSVTLCTPQYASCLLNDLSLTVKQGEHLLIMGPSGSGKTSLLRAVAGLWRSGSGTVRRYVYLPEEVETATTSEALASSINTQSDTSSANAQSGNRESDYNETGREGGECAARDGTAKTGTRESDSEGSVEGASVVKAEGAVADVEEGVMDAGGAVFFVPQRPYMVLGTLRQQLLYPTWSEGEVGGGGADDEGEGAKREGGEGSMEGWWSLGGLMQRLGGSKDGDAGGTAGFPPTPVSSLTSSPHNMAHRPQPSDEELLAVLDGVRLGHVAERQGGLDAQVEWASVLSLGEQQRLAFARLLLSRPELALMDECTSALDEDNEAHVYGLVEAAGVTFVSIGHRSSLRRFHTHLLSLSPSGGATGSSDASADVSDDARDSMDDVSSSDEKMGGRRVVARATGSMWTLERIGE
ncbi:hypothetical protein CLOM_g740 [Closterium sp. NIES-68]|nr:hypothetical protein CLOM_g740 [Closterium sp. NIES-68]GJP86645.1 hypothetical protein CLOP_g16643 [Closterium sp. NIES-67]